MTRIIFLTCLFAVLTTSLSAEAVAQNQLSELIAFLKTETVDGKISYAKVLDDKIQSAQKTGETLSTLTLGKHVDSQLVSQALWDKVIENKKVLVTAEFTSCGYQPNIYEILRHAISQNAGENTSRKLVALAKHKPTFDTLDKLYQKALNRRTVSDKDNSSEKMSVLDEVKSEIEAQAKPLCCEIEEQCLQKTRAFLSQHIDMQRHMICYIAKIGSGLVEEAVDLSEGKNRDFFQNKLLNIEYQLSGLDIDCDTLLNLFVDSYLHNKMVEANCYADERYQIECITDASVTAQRAKDIDAFINFLEENPKSKNVFVLAIQKALKDALDRESNAWRKDQIKQYILGSKFLLSICKND